MSREYTFQSEYKKVCLERSFDFDKYYVYAIKENSYYSNWYNASNKIAEFNLNQKNNAIALCESICPIYHGDFGDRYEYQETRSGAF